MGSQVTSQLVLFVFSLCFFSLISGCSQSEEITIGAILSLSAKDGTPQLLEQEVLDGMEFAIQTLNQSSSKTHQSIKLVYRDCRGEPELAKKQFRELAAMTPAIIINTYSHITRALTPLATEAKIPQLATVATAGELTDNAPYSFRYWPQASDEGAALLPIVKSLKVKMLGLINIDNEYGNSVSDTLTTMALKENIQTQKIVFSTIDQDFVNKLIKLKKCDAILFTCFPEQINQLAKTLRKNLPRKPLIGPNSIVSPHYVTHAILDGIHVAAPLIYNEAYPYAMDIGKKYTDRYSLPLSHYSAIGYDIIILLTQIFEEAGTTPDGILDSFNAGFVYPGLFGDVVNAKDSHDFSFPLYPAQLINKKIEFHGR